MNQPGEALSGLSLPPAAPAPAPSGPVGCARVKPIDRSQLTWQMLDVERLIDAEHPARAIWAVVGRLELDRFYAAIEATAGTAGCPAWDPRLLISLWIYAYSRGISSAREIARRCRYEPAFQWLCGLGEINHHTLSDFRVAQAEGLQHLFAQVLGVLSAEGLVTLERVMQDGTKIKALASTSSFCQQARLAEHLAAARQQVAAMGDPRGEETPRQRAAQARAQRERQQRLEAAQQQLTELQQAKPAAAETLRVSRTDPEARVMKQPGGGFAPAYNVQLSTDAAQKIIVGASVSQSGNDYGELLPAMAQLEQTFQRQPTQVVADGGFTCRSNIMGMATAGMDFYGSLGKPNPESAGQLAQRGISPEFYPSAFPYDPATNTCQCPAGKGLRPSGQKSRPETVEHSYRAEATDCARCPFEAQCCGQQRGKGRLVVRVEERPEVSAFRQKMKTDAAAQIYRQRSAVAEFPNAWIKAKLGLRQFRLRGLVKVGLEVLWACLTYNLQQWIRLSRSPKLDPNAA
jgi:transposase